MNPGKSCHMKIGEKCLIQKILILLNLKKQVLGKLIHYLCAPVGTSCLLGISFPDKVDYVNIFWCKFCNGLERYDFQAKRSNKKNDSLVS